MCSCFLWFHKVPWRTIRDDDGIPYFSLDNYGTVNNYVFSRLGFDLGNKGEKQKPGIARLENVLFYAKHNYMKNHFKSKRKLVWTSSSGESVMLRGCVDMALIESAMNHIPEDIYPVDKSVKKLVKQLSACEALDDIHVMEKGMSEKIVRLNATSYPQPRRISWSVTLGDVYHDGVERCLVRDLFSYSQSYRPPSDWRARPMPTDVFNLGVHLWAVTYGHLSAISRVCPPTGCHVMIYHSQFGNKGGCVGYHRDNGLLKPDGRIGQVGYNEDENSQICTLDPRRTCFSYSAI